MVFSIPINKTNFKAFRIQITRKFKRQVLEAMPVLQRRSNGIFKVSLNC